MYFSCKNKHFKYQWIINILASVFMSTTLRLTLIDNCQNTSITQPRSSLLNVVVPQPKLTVHQPKPCHPQHNHYYNLTLNGFPSLTVSSHWSVVELCKAIKIKCVSKSTGCQYPCFEGCYNTYEQ